MSYKDTFTNIYENNGFGSEESKSGPGSTLEETKMLREKIKDLVKEKNIKSVVDIPCGDFNWMKEIVSSFESYIGGDIVEEAIKINNENYGDLNTKFIEFDLINDNIPDADLLIVRDVIGHLPLSDGEKVIKNILKSNCKYLLSTTWAKKTKDGWKKCDPNEVHRENEGVDYGRFYPVNLMSSPFNFPEADVYLEEDVRVDNFENGIRKILGLWDIEKLRGRHLISLFEKYGGDKIESGYSKLYASIFSDVKDKEIKHLEIGLGTLVPDVPSSFFQVPRFYPQYQPSNCLRVWRDYFINGKIYGIDVQEDCIIEEDRIKTFLGSSTDKEFCDSTFGKETFDIILDDGLHTAEAQIETFRNFFNRLNDDGYYIIEDIVGGGDGISVFEKYHDEIMSHIGEHEFIYRGNFLCVRKNYTKRGSVDLNDFLIQKKEVIPTINVNKNLTIVTGLWDINRVGRDFSHYIENFKRFLDIPQNLFIYIPKEYEYLVWEKRTKENTFVKVYELENIKNLYSPFWDKTQEIRKSPEWLGQAGWLPESPQAKLEWYNPIVQSKMFMLNDASIWNPFNTEYFFWLDAGITNTVPHTHLVENNILDKLTEYGNPFLFLSYPYEANTEIHGFEFNSMNRFAGSKVEYVCRGGLFGGHKQQLNEANATYYSLLSKTLGSGLMGTEESLFTIMSYNEPDLYRRYELDGNGLVVKFTQSVIDNDVKIVIPDVSKITNTIKYTDRDVDNVKTNLYILTFNFPEQVLHTIKSMEKTPIWLNKPHLVLLDNSTTEEVREQNREIAKQYNFEYISLGGNTGICGGRQSAAEHFHESDADFMFFFEDDMTVNPPELEGQFCRNGFRKYVPNLYNIVHKIMLRDKFDFLKLTFTEVYFDNDKQCTWYNVPQTIRTRDWPDYDKLPVTGLDPNAPLTNFKNMRVFDGLSYLDGEVYYANWPMIVSKEGNKKMFIDTKWGHPFEQTWMSHIYQETKLGNIKPAILLAAPIWHDRIKHYESSERREN